MNIVYRISSTIMRHLFSVIYRTTWYGLENIPKDGPLIVACNHVSFFDPPLIGCSAHRDFPISLGDPHGQPYISMASA